MLNTLAIVNCQSFPHQTSETIDLSNFYPARICTYDTVTSYMDINFPSLLHHSTRDPHYS